MATGTKLEESVDKLGKNSLKTDTDKDIETLHHEMVVELSRQIAPGVVQSWVEFRNMMKMHIEAAPLAECTSLIDICEKLFIQGTLSFGKYDVLFNAFKIMKHKPCQDIISKYTSEIKEKRNIQRDTRTVEKMSSQDPPDKPDVKAKVTIKHTSPSILLSEVYDEMFATLHQGLKKIRESKDLSSTEYIEEIKSLNTEMSKTLELCKTFEMRGVPLTNVTKNCLMLVFEPQSKANLEQLWDMYNSGELLNILQDGLISERQLKRCNADSIQLDVYMQKEEYLECLKKIEINEEKMMATTIQTRRKEDNQCPHHHTDLTLSCTQCGGEPICVMCISTLHNGHPCQKISRIVYEKKNKIQEYLTKIENTDIQDIRIQLQFIDDKIKKNSHHFKKLENEIELRGKKMIEDIKKITKEMVDKSKVLQEENSISLFRYKQELESVHVQLTETVEKYRKILEAENNIMVFNTEIDFEEEMKLPAFPNLKVAHLNAGQNLQDGFGALDIGDGALDIEEGEEMLELHKEPPYCAPVSNVMRPEEAMFHYTTTSDVWLSEADKVQLCNLSQSDVVTRYRSKTSNVESEFTHSVCIISVEKSSSENIWVSYNRDRIISLVNLKGEELQKIELGSTVQDISVSPVTGNLWLCCTHDNTIYEVLQNSPTKRFRPDSSAWCLCMTPDENVVVGTKHNIVVYNTTGQELCTTQSSGPRYVVTPRHITICPSTGDIAVCVWDCLDAERSVKPHVSVFNSKLEINYRYYGYRQSDDQSTISDFNPWDAVYDSRGRLFIVDHDKRLIHLVNGEGQFLTIVHADELKPKALTLIKDGLLCVGFISKKIKTIRYTS